MSTQAEVFTHVIEHFGAESESLRSAAAFAAGNIAIGNLHRFLPVIVKSVENDPKKRLLYLHALKEVRLQKVTSELHVGTSFLTGCYSLFASTA
jgi:cullin-associated NEDD8-dissociated protein 1